MRKSKLVDENPQAGLRSKNGASYTCRIDVHLGQWFGAWPEASFLTGFFAIVWFAPEAVRSTPDQSVIVVEYGYEKKKWVKVHSALRNLERALIKDRNNCGSR